MKMCYSKQAENLRHILRIERRHRMSSEKYPFSIIALDLDGTLTNSKKELTERTRLTLLRLQEKGIRLILASGRPTYGVEPLARKLELSRFGGFILSYNGGKITDCTTGKTLFRQHLPQTGIPKLAALQEKLKITVLTYEGTCIVTEHPDDPYVIKESIATGMEVRQIRSFADYVTYPVTKCLMVGDPTLLAEAEHPVANALGKEFSVYRSEPYFLEIVPQGIDKANSLKILLQQLSLKREDLAAFGDGFNDINMLRYAGTGIAMANAGALAKEAADDFTLSNDEDGVAVYLEKAFKIDFE